LKRLTYLAALAAALLLAGCAATAPPPPPTVTPIGDDRFIVDPRIGWTAPAPPKIDQLFDAAWRYSLGGEDMQALSLKRLGEIRIKAPDYEPAHLASAARLIRLHQYDEAKGIVDEILKEFPDYTAARIYDAELTLAAGDLRGALTRYRTISEAGNAPTTVGERIATIESRLYESLIGNVAGASDAEAIAFLREALTLRPSETEPRITLAQRLIATKQFEESRKILEPVINSTAVDRPEVQAALAEIDVSRGRYQEAIVRLDRLSRRTRDAQHLARLEAVKQLWSTANMPPQYNRALASESITRADLAVLMYWEMNSVRFAQNLASPPIAVDLTDVVGREETIRAIAIGLYDVDPITRRVSPMRPITAGAFTRYAAKLLTLRGAPCARIPYEPGEMNRSAKILVACGVNDALFTSDPDTAVTGRAAAQVLEQVEKALGR
jgi:tetratricopeptide (TPR) repeat protein